MKIGWMAFLVGIVGALILGLLQGFGVAVGATWITTVLVIAGIIIGLMNISEKETVPFMISAFVIGLGSAGLATLPFVGGMFNSVLISLVQVASPAGVVVAIKTVISKSMS